MASSDRPFRLFDLPRELRDQIYDYLVYDRVKTVAFLRSSNAPPARVVINNSRLPQMPWVSRRLRDEYQDQVPPPSRITVQLITYEPAVDSWSQPDLGLTHLHLDAYVFCRDCLQHDGFGSSPFCIADDFIEIALFKNTLGLFKSHSLKIGFLTWCIEAMGFAEFKREHSRIFMQLEELPRRIPTLKGVELIKYSGVESFDSIMAGDSWRYTLASWSQDEGWKAAPGRE